jgi:hypothetical protein
VSASSVFAPHPAGADCNTKFNADCNPDTVKCDFGETYEPTLAQECIDSYEAFSCDEVRGFGDGTTQSPQPAARSANELLDSTTLSASCALALGNAEEPRSP